MFLWGCRIWKTPITVTTGHNNIRLSIYCFKNLIYFIFPKFVINNLQINTAQFTTDTLAAGELCSFPSVSQTGPVTAAECVCLQPWHSFTLREGDWLIGYRSVFFGLGSQVWLSLVSDGCLYCHHKMAPALHCDVHAWLMWPDRQSCVCMFYKRVLVLVCLPVCVWI